MEESNLSATWWKVCYSSSLGIPTKGSMHFGLLFWGAEWKMSKERPWHYLALLCMKLKKGSPIPRLLLLTCLRLQPSLVLHGLSRWDSLGCLGVRFTAYALLSMADVWKCLPSEARHSFFLGCNNYPVHVDHMQKGARQCLQIYTKVMWKSHKSLYK